MIPSTLIAPLLNPSDMLRALVPSPLFDSLVNPLSVELLKLENVLPTRTVDFALNYEYPHLKPDSPDRILETLPLSVRCSKLKLIEMPVLELAWNSTSAP